LGEIVSSNYDELFFSDGLNQTTNQEMSLARKHESRPKAFEALLDFLDEKFVRGFSCVV